MEVPVIHQVNQAKAAIKDLQVIIDLLDQVQKVKTPEGHGAVPEAFAALSDVAVHVKAIQVDFAKLEKLAGLEWVVIADHIAEIKKN